MFICKNGINGQKGQRTEHRVKKGSLLAEKYWATCRKLC